MSGLLPETEFSFPGVLLSLKRMLSSYRHREGYLLSMISSDQAPFGFKHHRTMLKNIEAINKILNHRESQQLSAVGKQWKRSESNTLP